MRSSIASRSRPPFLPLLCLSCCITSSTAGMAATAEPDSPGSAEPAGADPALPLSLEDLAFLVAQRIQPDGTSERRQLAGLLDEIRARLDPVLGLPGTASAAGVPEPDPFAGGDTQWHLWAFWSVDSPSSAGMAPALVAALAAHPLVLHVVHVAGIRQWEAWLARQSAQRESLLEAARRQDAAGCRTISLRWRRASMALGEMAARFYPGGVAAWAELQPAIALRVESVPCFRLLSPRHVVHVLDGFSAGYDLSAWIARAKAWESAHAPELP